jgi:hypothetical protein
MSEKLLGDAVSLEVNTGTTELPVWKMIACITANGLDSATEEIDGDSKCGPDPLIGNITWSATVEGFYDLSPDAGFLSGQGLLVIYKSKVLKEYRMKNADGTYYRGFSARLANYKEKADHKTIVTFSTDLKIPGDIVDVEPA